ncbi:MAG: hypothetical protein ISR57_07330 [Bacteroidales bacterium]|nr:hypothetical protein [Bacteroidales bacterium]
MSEEKIHREDERLDNMFRDSLGEMRVEPSAGVWNKVKRSLFRSELLRFNFVNVRKAYRAVIPAALLVIGAVLYFGLLEGDVVSQQQPGEKVVIPNQVQSTPEEPTITIAPAVTETIPEEFPTIIVLPVVEPTPERSISEDLNTLICLDPEINMTSLSFPASILPVANPVPAETSQEPVRKQRPQSFDIGLNITPDMVFYRNPSSSFKYNYTFDAGTKYNIGRFYLQSGLGATYSTAIGDYAISYRKNDSIGYYYVISSYSVDPGEPGVQLETKQVTVYDSVNYFYDYSTKNRYLYLQIPLNFGYRIIDKPRWRLSVEAGLLYAYLISITEPTPSFYMPEARILDIARRTPERNRHTLGFTGSISVEYQFARNFYLLIEPTFKYYMQAIEESSSIGSKQPYSIGLRAGIWYRLNINPKSR